MFEDNRSRKLILVAHCVLNQNSISDGTADFPSQFSEVVELLMENQVGIIQLPCPELTCLGLDRQDTAGAQRELLSENTRIRGLMEGEHNLRELRDRSDDVVTQVGEYRRHGFDVLGLIGINRSPSCGVETTSRNAREEPGKGVFVAAIEERLRTHGITLRMIGVKTSAVAESLAKVRELIRKSGRDDGKE
jgi:predicted secreted protein